MERAGLKVLVKWLNIIKNQQVTSIISDSEEFDSGAGMCFAEERKLIERQK